MRKLLAIVALTGCLAASPAHAQGGPLTLTLGVGGGWAGTTCSGCIATNENGPSGLVQLAVRATPALQVGAEWAGWSQAQFGERGRLDFAMLAAELHPSELPGLFVKASAGYGWMRFHVADLYGGSSDTAEYQGLASGFGAGYDLSVGRHLAVAPYAQIIVTRAGAGRVGRFDVERQSASILQYGLLLRVR